FAGVSVVFRGRARIIASEVPVLELVLIESELGPDHPVAVLELAGLLDADELGLERIEARRAHDDPVAVLPRPRAGRDVVGDLERRVIDGRGRAEPGPALLLLDRALEAEEAELPAGVHEDALVVAGTIALRARARTGERHRDDIGRLDRPDGARL